MTTFNLTCEAVETILPDYLDETLEAWVRKSIDEHLGECAQCAGLAHDLRNMEREAAALPALFPERDLWPEVAHGIGAPVFTSVSVPESEPLMASSEPPVLESASLPVNEAALVLPSAEAFVPTNAPAIALPRRREPRRGPAWMGLAAAALILVTAGATFLLTVRWVGPARTPYVATDTANRPLSSSATPPGDRGIRAPSVGRQQIASDSSASTPPGSMRSSLTVATTPAPQVARSPDEVVYDKEIDMLQAMRRRRKDELDASTAAVIERICGLLIPKSPRSEPPCKKIRGAPCLAIRSRGHST